jgi:CRISPR system Cascade subunit CasB
MPSDTNHGSPDFIGLYRRYENLSPGQKAELRRIAAPDKLRDIPSLYRLFPRQQISDNWLRVAFLLPHCRHRNDALSLGSQFAAAKVNEARLFQVVRANEPIDLIQLRRLVFQVQPTVDWSQCGWTLLIWNKEKKRELLEDYFISKTNL